MTRGKQHPAAGGLVFQSPDSFRDKAGLLLAHRGEQRDFAAIRGQGRPLALPRTGDAPSFEALAQSVTRDVHPRTLLGELCRLELVTCNTDIDTVALKQPAFVPRADQAHMLSLLADNVGDHLRAAVDNVLGSGDAHFEQAVYADELSLQSVQALRPLIAAQWADLLGRMAPELERRIADDRTERRAQDQRVRIGFYSFAAPMAGAAPAQRSCSQERGLTQPVR